ncbi:PREDICTED: endoribonuclease LACTB2 isoform X2 [Trachymyrmex cornetzi]|uniref:Beta-lactamase-like protein 2 homolog n=2 Tax=Trachymyrmex cornetzi TaxID=471704 RepID=A0A195DSL8_9HYME|nr:PREDICTED: endoribonuclease LACTB2 isoform X2 [Trachymyrmex cornetzi]KYN15843.1 Beta-lactamase-like protein 2 [Trachymyrmex cornetzi]
MTSLTYLPPIARLSSKVIRILGCNPGPMTLQGTNTYLVGTGRRRVLVDSGEAKTANDYIKLLDSVLNEENATIEHLVVTHWHHDHIGGVEPVRNLIKRLFPMEKQVTVWKLPRSLNDTSSSDCEKSIEWKPLKNDQVVEVEGAKLQVKYTPGHTSDHACLLLQGENILFSGDCILGESTTVFEDLHDYMLSLNKILEIQPKIIYPGHGPVLNDPMSQIQYYIKHRQQREEEILQMLQQQGNDKSMTEMDIVKLIYKGTPEKLWLAAAFTVGHHLRKLAKEGKVLQEEEGGWRRIRGKI